MDKMKMESVDIRQKNIDKIAEMFPGAITEKLDEKESTSERKIYKKAINFDMLRQLLSEEEIGDSEVFEFTWVGKKKALIEANTPIRKTLRPHRSNSINWESTCNLYIEGDNSDALKLLQESYLGKIKLIYIDPPYNTGNDFIYRDNYSMDINEYNEEIGILDDNYNKLFQNTMSNGRFHSDWCSMIYQRLILAKNLLAENGAIFISIDDNEVGNLRKICDEVFGESNLIAQFPWQSRQSIQNDTDISSSHEYIVAYAKNRRIENRRLKESNVNSWFGESSFVCLPLPLDKDKFLNPDNDPRGLWKADPFDAPNIRPNLTYVIKNPNTGEEFLPPNGRHWRTEEKSFEKLLADNRIVFGKNGTSRPQLKVFYEEKKMFGSIDNTWWTGDKCGTSTQGTKELMDLFDKQTTFDTPKPVKLIKKIISLVSMPEDNDIILDFFAGSSTTMQAVFEQNLEDKGNRRCILIQLPASCDENSNAYKEGYKNICEIGKERIRRAGDKILSENPDAPNLDIGFRVFKVDDSNMKDVYYAAGDYNQNILDMIESNIKEDRTDLDLLFSCILEWGMPLSLPYVEEDIDGVKIHNVADGDLIACFEENINEEVIKKIASREQKPLRVVFRDRSFVNSPAKINVEEIFKLLSPNTKIKVL